MKRVYNYRNTTDINCIVSNSPIGFKMSDYPNINNKRSYFHLNPFSDTLTWVTNQNTSLNRYHINISFKERKVICKLNGNNKPDNIFLRSSNYYYHIQTEEVGSFEYFSREYPEYFFRDKTITTVGERKLEKIVLDVLDFNFDIEDITSMKVENKWYKSSIYITVNFKKQRKTGLDYINFKFDKSDKEDVNFIIQEIDSIRKSIQSEEQERLLERWEE